MDPQLRTKRQKLKRKAIRAGLSPDAYLEKKTVSKIVQETPVLPMPLERGVRTASGLSGSVELDLIARSANWNQDKLYPLATTAEELHAMIQSRGGSPTHEERCLLVVLAGMRSDNEIIRQKAVDTFAKLATMNQKERLKRLDLLHGQKSSSGQTNNTQINIGGPSTQDIVREAIESGNGRRLIDEFDDACAESEKDQLPSPIRGIGQSRQVDSVETSAVD